MNEEAFKNEQPCEVFCSYLLHFKFFSFFLSSFLLLIKLIHEKLFPHLLSHKQIIHLTYARVLSLISFSSTPLLKSFETQVTRKQCAVFLDSRSLAQIQQNRIQSVDPYGTILKRHLKFFNFGLKLRKLHFFLKEF